MSEREIPEPPDGTRLVLELETLFNQRALVVVRNDLLGPETDPKRWYQCHDFSKSLTWEDLQKQGTLYRIGEQL